MEQEPNKPYQPQNLEELDENIDDSQQEKLEQKHFITTYKEKEEKDEIQREFKIIRNEFISLFDKSDLWLFFEFCLFEPELVVYLLRNRQKPFLRQLKRDLMKNHKEGYKTLNGVIAEFCQKNNIKNWQQYREQRHGQRFEQENKLEKQKSKQKKQEKQLTQNNDNEDEKIDFEQEDEENNMDEQQQEEEQVEPGILMNVSDCVVIKILEFLDPRSLGRFQITCHRHKELGQKNYLFKKFCVKLHRQGISPLPEETHFKSFQAFVAQQPLSFNPIFSQRVANNVRNIIWPDIDQFKTPMGYFRKFKSWYSMYLVAPRVNFKGLYRIKEKYVRVGEKSLNQQFTPVIEVLYYRYFRFFPNGTVKYKLSNKKIKEDKLLEIFMNNDPNFMEKNDVILGEYLICKNKLVIKYSCRYQIFEYVLEIQHKENLPNQMLKVIKQTEWSPDSDYLHIIFQQGPTKTDKYYKYIPINEFVHDIPDKQIAAMSL